MKISDIGSTAGSKISETRKRTKSVSAVEGHTVPILIPRGRSLGAEDTAKWFNAALQEAYTGKYGQGTNPTDEEVNTIPPGTRLTDQ